MEISPSEFKVVSPVSKCRNPNGKISLAICAKFPDRTDVAGSIVVVKSLHNPLAEKALRSGDEEMFEQNYAAEANQLRKTSLSNERLATFYGYAKCVDTSHDPPRLALMTVWEFLPRRGPVLEVTRASRNKGHSISFALKCKWIKQLLGALSYLHSQQVVHANLKTKNVFVDADFDVKLTDYSSPKFLDLANFRSLQPETFWRDVFREALPYSSARRLIGKIIPAEDVYSFGVVCYEIASDAYTHATIDFCDKVRKKVEDITASGEVNIVDESLAALLDTELFRKYLPSETPQTIHDLLLNARVHYGIHQSAETLDEAFAQRLSHECVRGCVDDEVDRIRDLEPTTPHEFRIDDAMIKYDAARREESALGLSDAVKRETQRRSERGQPTGSMVSGEAVHLSKGARPKTLAPTSVDTFAATCGERHLPVSPPTEAVQQPITLSKYPSEVGFTTTSTQIYNKISGSKETRHYETSNANQSTAVLKQPVDCTSGLRQPIDRRQVLGTARNPASFQTLRFDRPSDRPSHQNVFHSDFQSRSQPPQYQEYQQHPSHPPDNSQLSGQSRYFHPQFQPQQERAYRPNEDFVPSHGHYRPQQERQGRLRQQQEPLPPSSAGFYPTVSADNFARFPQQTAYLQQLQQQNLAAYYQQQEPPRPYVPGSPTLPFPRQESSSESGESNTTSLRENRAAPSAVGHENSASYYLPTQENRPRSFAPTYESQEPPEVRTPSSADLSQLASALSPQMVVACPYGQAPFLPQQYMHPPPPHFQTCNEGNMSITHGQSHIVINSKQMMPINFISGSKIHMGNKFVTKSVPPPSGPPRVTQPEAPQPSAPRTPPTDLCQSDEMISNRESRLLLNVTIEKWRDFALQLGLSPGDVTEIEHDYGRETLSEKVQRVLERWKEQEARGASLRRFALALWRCGQGQLARRVGATDN